MISTSYGYREADLTVFYVTRQCSEYAKLGLMGVTVLFSSGDNGVGGSGGCLNSDGVVLSFTQMHILTGVFCTGTSAQNGTIFNPSFPSTCPYVTSVGATQLSPGKTIADGEDACERVIYSGGGFSNSFAIPDYQKEAVGSYLKNNPPPYSPSIWNSTGQVGWMCYLSVQFMYAGALSLVHTLMSPPMVQTT